jgi:riboflavin kinase/FMN adenylyltransferase
MHIIRHLEALPPEARGGAVSIGNFDGVHLGHLAIVRQLLQRADEVGGPAIVFTFDPHPVRILRPEQCPPPLTWTERKAQLLAAQGVDWIVAYPTDEALLQLTADQFFKRIVRDTLAARALVEGENFYFGHNREGDVRRLSELASAAGISLEIVRPVEVDGAIASSSRVRDLISRGDVQTANKLLSAPYRIRGMVTHGAGRGAKIGFPTANLAAIDTLLPAQGVYAGRAWITDANESGDPAYGPSPWPAAINLGPSPTFGDPTLRVEIHVVGLDEPLYGQPLEVDFLARLRDIRPFDSPAVLVEQLKQDVTQVQQIAADPTRGDEGVSPRQVPSDPAHPQTNANSPSPPAPSAH